MVITPAINTLAWIREQRREDSVRHPTLRLGARNCAACVKRPATAFARMIAGRHTGRVGVDGQRGDRPGPGVETCKCIASMGSMFYNYRLAKHVTTPRVNGSEE
ncbi:MAG: hypothetical protein AAGA55_12145 [Planctomycetota bacterium]